MSLTAAARYSALVLCAALSSCASAPMWITGAPPLAGASPGSALSQQKAVADPAVVSLREKLVAAARSVVGRKELVVRGRRFAVDCTGTVLAIYWAAGIDLGRDFNRYTGNGVSRLYRTLERENLLYTTARPLPGDIVFWDNTYDLNGDGLRNDPLTHVGVVVAVDPDATVSYVHAHVRNGIVVESMNLLSPGTRTKMQLGQMKILNSPMRMAGYGGESSTGGLSGELYRVLGMGYLLPVR